MSRIGNQVIVFPESVALNFENQIIKVSGPLGKIEKEFKQKVIQFELKDNLIYVTRNKEDNFSKSLHGLYKALLTNMILGVVNYFNKRLILNGVGYKVQQKSTETLTFILGYSHPIDYVLPNIIKATIKDNGTNLLLESIDKELLGQVAAKIRKLRPPEPYKKKGIRYENEFIMVKAGKSVKK